MQGLLARDVYRLDCGVGGEEFLVRRLTLALSPAFGGRGRNRTGESKYESRGCSHREALDLVQW